jgi:hypothetical protein
MSVIGIQKDTVHRSSIVLPIERTLDALYALTLDPASATGLLGATAWALASARDERAKSALEIVENRFEASRSSSMEIGLVLSGLSAVVEAFPDSRAAPRLAASASRELLDRFSESGQLFRGASWALRPRRAVQWNMTSFATQVYPIHGLAEYARVTGTSPAREILRAADRVVELQGPLGQWWWIYRPRTGSVVEGYPVFSVHQHAMAFMALAPLVNLGLRDYRKQLGRGLQWIFGSNELDTPLVNFDADFFARCIQRRGGEAEGLLGMSRSQWWRAVLSSWSRQPRMRPEPGLDELEVLEEYRPYELGWLLYARSLAAGW